MMNTFEHDILQSSKELKERPFKVPEGYFDNLRAEALKCTEIRRQPVRFCTRVAPYAAVAAMFAFILTLGKLFISPEMSNDLHMDEDEIGIYEDFLVFSGSDAEISMHYLTSENYENDELADEEIIEYLIYIGATEEYIESNNE